MALTERARWLRYNLFGRGRIHGGEFFVPYTRFAAVPKRKKDEEGKKMGLRYCPWPPWTDVTPIVFNGSGTDFATISMPIFPAGAPVPEAIIHLVACGTWSAAPGTIHARMTDENGDVVCPPHDLPASTALSACIDILTIATGIAGRGGLELQIAASNAITLTPNALGSAGLVFWEE